MRSAVWCVLLAALVLGVGAWEESHGLLVKRAFRSATSTASRGAVTLSLQSSLDRLKALERHARTWNGPISVAVLLQSKQEADIVAAEVDGYDDAVKKHVTLHLAVPTGDPLAEYPINQMRNIALEDVATEWLYVLDIDESSVFNMHDHLAAVMSAISENDADSAVFMVPAFEWAHMERPAIPKSKSELNVLFDNGLAVVKHMHFPRAYLGAFDVSKWFSTKKAVHVQYQDGFEPYFISRTSPRIRFDDAFVGFGHNKAQLAFQLAASGMRFISLTSVFNFADECNEEYSVQYSTRDLEQSRAVTEAFWSRVGEEHGCSRCTPYSCVVSCPSMFGQANAKKSTVLLNTTPPPKTLTPKSKSQQATKQQQQQPDTPAQLAPPAQAPAQQAATQQAAPAPAPAAPAPAQQATTEQGVQNVLAPAL